MDSARRISGDLFILPSFFPIPGYGGVEINSYLIRSAEPILIDTGAHHDREEFVSQLSSLIDPGDLRWIWLSHPDHDHTGSLKLLLEMNPEARLVTSFQSMGVMSLHEPVDPKRVYLVHAGEGVDIGDRTLRCMRPPTYDSPATTGFYDPKLRVYFSADAFGALLPSAYAEAREIPEADLREGQITWATLDAPWLHHIDRTRFRSTLDGIRSLQPEWILSAHLAPARGMIDTFFNTMLRAPDATPFVGLNQAGLDLLLARAEGAPAR